MGALNVLTVNLAFSTLVFAIAARIYVMPLLRERSARTVLVPILLLHAFRNLGLMFLSPGATYAGIPMEFAPSRRLRGSDRGAPGAPGPRGGAARSPLARPLLWVFNVEGTLDLAHAISPGQRARRLQLHGAGLLDPRLLGPGPPGHPLHRLRHPPPALERALRSHFACSSLHLVRVTPSRFPA